MKLGHYLVVAGNGVSGRSRYFAERHEIGVAPAGLKTAALRSLAAAQDRGAGHQAADTSPSGALKKGDSTVTKPLQTYEAPGIVVTFDANVCTHSGRCVRGLPAVFDVRRKRWVRPEAASPDEVAAQVARCPSGALQARRTGGEGGQPA